MPRFSDEKLQQFYDEFDVCRKQTQEDRERIFSALRENTQTVKAQAKATEDLVAAWDAAQGFVKIMAAIASMAKALIPIGLFFGGLWYFIKTGHWTK